MQILKGKTNYEETPSKIRCAGQRRRRRPAVRPAPASRPAGHQRRPSAPDSQTPTNFQESGEIKKKDKKEKVLLLLLLVLLVLLLLLLLLVTTTTTTTTTVTTTTVTTTTTTTVTTTTTTTTTTYYHSYSGCPKVRISEVCH